MKNFDLKQLENIPLFQGIRPDEIQRILTCCQAKPKHYQSHETIFHEGYPVTHVGIVLSGTVQIMQDDYRGNRNIILTVQATNVFAEVYAYAEIETLPISAVAAEDCEILLMDCKKSRMACCKACGFHSRFISNMLSIMAKNNLLLNQKIEIISKRTTKEKIMAFLLGEAKNAGSNSFRIAYDRQALADYLGVDRSAMSTEISKLQKEGMIEVHKKSFWILK